VGLGVLLEDVELVKLDVIGADGEIEALAPNESVGDEVPVTDELSESVDVEV